MPVSVRDLPIDHPTRVRWEREQLGEEVTGVNPCKVVGCSRPAKHPPGTRGLYANLCVEHIDEKVRASKSRSAVVPAASNGRSETFTDRARSLFDVAERVDRACLELEAATKAWKTALEDSPAAV